MNVLLLSITNYEKTDLTLLIQIMLITIVEQYYCTRSLQRHAGDISRARQLTENDILCLTESKITNDTDVAEIKEQLSNFEIYFNSCSVRLKTLAFCLGQNIVLSKHETFSGISLLIFQKAVFHTIQYGVCCCIVFQVHLSQHSIIRWKTYLVTIHHTIDLALSDFNIDILNSTNINLPNVLSDYTLLVNEATHISGSLLYHAYVNALEVLG